MDTASYASYTPYTIEEKLLSSGKVIQKFIFGRLCPLDKYLSIIAECQEVYLPPKFNHPIHNLPYGILKIVIYNSNYSHLISNLPASLLNLIIYMKNARNYVRHLPHGLQEISIYELDFDYTILPSTCTKITFLDAIDSKILEELPDTIEEIELTHVYISHQVSRTPSRIPAHLKRIILHIDMDTVIDTVLSSSKYHTPSYNYISFKVLILQLNPNVIFQKKTNYL